VGDNCDIGKEVVNTGPSVIGSECRIEDAGDDFQLYHLAKVTIGSGCRLSSSIVANGCHIHQGSDVMRVVLGNDVSVSQGQRLEPGIRIEPVKPGVAQKKITGGKMPTIDKTGENRNLLPTIIFGR
jgi:mannose-1-phosphate guanylyltransferase